MTSSSSAEAIRLARSSDSAALVTREQGKALLTLVLSFLDSNNSIILSLEGAEALSPSFADELFAGLDQALGEEFKTRVRIECARPEWRRLISSALQHRRSQPRKAAG